MTVMDSGTIVAQRESSGGSDAVATGNIEIVISGALVRLNGTVDASQLRLVLHRQIDPEQKPQGTAALACWRIAATKSGRRPYSPIAGQPACPSPRRLMAKRPGASPVLPAVVQTVPVREPIGQTTIRDVAPRYAGQHRPRTLPLF